MSYLFTVDASKVSPDVHYLRVHETEDDPLPDEQAGVEVTPYMLQTADLRQLKTALDAYLDGITVCANCGQFKRSHPLPHGGGGYVGCALFQAQPDPQPGDACTLPDCPDRGRPYDRHSLASFQIPGQHGRDRRLRRAATGNRD